MKKTLLYIIGTLLMACNSENKNECSLQDSANEVTLLKDRVSIKLPSEWVKVDSSRFYDKAIIYNNIIMSNDSSSFAILSISDYSIYQNIKIVEKDFFSKMKAKMKERNRGSDSLVQDVIKEINGHKVNFLKYSEIASGGRTYFAHIGFLLPEKKQVEIELKTSGSTQKQTEKIIDCIFASLKVK